jgi:nucleoside-diphosphate-sugar epimerase
MKVLVTGHNGYIGSVLVPFFRAAGHEVMGLDSYLYEACTFGDEIPDVPAIRCDLRDVLPSHLRGFDAIVHLAALCNDPLGNLNKHTTYEVNHEASVHLAELAKEAGVPRFLFASSCSLYGTAGDDFLTEEASFSPITAYGESKVLVERDVAKLADDRFTPVYLRNATAYGFSPRLRVDVVVNNLVAYAHTTGEINIQSDGTPWRPLVHVEDISRAFLSILEAPRANVHNQAFNVGQTSENYRVSQLADVVMEVVPGCRVTYAEGGGPDPRCYRVNCDKLPSLVPAFQPKWTVRRGIEELYTTYGRYGLRKEDFFGSRYPRIKYIQRLQSEGRLDADLRWLSHAQTKPESPLHLDAAAKAS